MKNSLMFINELASVKRVEPSIAVFLKAALPNVLIKTVYEKNFIASEAKKACSNVS
jgi:hypothetical protein